MDEGSGLPATLQAQMLLERDGHWIPDPSRTLIITPSYGNPVLGTIYLDLLLLPYNPLPPPSWLYNTGLQASFGFDGRVWTNATSVLLHANPYADRFGVNVTESWSLDDPVFPATHRIQSRVAEGLQWSIVLQRLTPASSLPHWPVFCAAAPLELPKGERFAWTGVPPLGDGEVGREFDSFRQAIEHDNQDLNFEAGTALWGTGSIWRIDSNPIPNSPIPWYFGYVRVEIPKGGSAGVIGEHRAVAGVATPWQTTRDNHPSGLQLPVHGPLPELFTLTDLFQRWNVSLTDDYVLLVNYDFLTSEPAVGVVLGFAGPCEGGTAVSNYVSAWTGEVLYREPYPC